MPEVEHAKQTQRFVELLLDLGVTDPWFYRMMIGRLYYAAHHLARRLLVEAGLQPEQWRGGVHQRVIDELVAHYVAPGRLRREAVRALADLRDLRARADYRLDWGVRLRSVKRAEELLSIVAGECFRVLGVS